MVLKEEWKIDRILPPLTSERRINLTHTVALPERLAFSSINSNDRLESLRSGKRGQFEREIVDG
ncbi:hypothetical protein PVK06_008786 [Gossypium arboreum]|uniref:Uncharacterized protein n=1 Tax=Gossypium arboreum TaxID=29729 RepID=A0ABR0QLR9_GOSAR|nr:hypothetical protein PVK06_008786 [Gossypium arboreum]